MSCQISFKTVTLLNIHKGIGSAHKFSYLQLVSFEYEQSQNTFSKISRCLGKKSLWKCTLYGEER